MNGLMAGGTMESGKTTTCMAKVSILGKMVENMKDTITTIGNMALEYTPGKMVDSTSVSGRMESNMAKEHIDKQQDRRKEECGKTERESSGLNESYNFDLLDLLIQHLFSAINSSHFFYNFTTGLCPFS